MNISWKLFLDDLREPPDKTWVVARSSKEALDLISIRGLPKIISFDHDLGGEDTAIVFLNALIPEFLETNTEIPKYVVHSANPLAFDNISSKMNTWKKYVENYS